MTNGIVNGTGLENQFGEWQPSSFPPLEVCTERYTTASLGINGTKSAYVPPHLRNSQRAASSPVVPTTGYV
jgi:ATP-dependent RNA helicase DDX3X